MAEHSLIFGATGDLGQDLLEELEEPVGVSRSGDPDIDGETIQADITEEIPDL